ncbi:uncharacterized protein LOC135501412 isoform X1 [Lineus longissimus]|uniref:uncharacterized protein LOC135501412 isoform X1 n=1 Tax=Lineus longissimus TaxID=88925 RepID=UPI00315D2639
MVFSAVADAPARCLLQDVIQFNGNFGCGSCLAKGTSVKTSERGQTHAYPMDTHVEHFGDGHTSIRTHQLTKTHAEIALRSGEPEKEVKGYSPQFFLPLFNIIRGVTVDYMHCTLLGVQKWLLTRWLDSSQRSEAWYIGKSMKKLNERMNAFCPPNVISRIPRQLGELSNWKASEYRTFLLFSSLPVLYGILDDQYYQHYLLFVEAIHILLQSSITKMQLKKAKHLLRHFCLLIECLYGARHESSNMHALLHLSEKVQDLGPLWAHSCFFYEDLNGDLRHHGTQNVQVQIIIAVFMQQKIPEMVDCLLPYSEAAKYYHHLTKRHVMTRQVTEEINRRQFAVGTMVSFCPEPNIMEDIRQMLGNQLGSCEKFKRLINNGQMIHSEEYTMATRRNSYTIKFVDSINGNGGYAYASVKYYMKVVLPDRCAYLAVVRLFEEVTSFHLSTDKVASVPHLHPVKVGDSCAIVPVSAIIGLHVFVSMPYLPCCFAADLPNHNERD